MKGVEMSVSKMTHWERVTAAVAGEAVDRVPVSLWRHFPESDRDPARLAEACVAWQRMHDFDLVKFMPGGTYGVEDWGATSADVGSLIGARAVIKPGVTAAEGWPRLARLSPTEGQLGREVKALALAAEALGGDVPILQTLFSPFGVRYDRLVLDALAGESKFTMVHFHGNDVMFGQVLQYPANMMNWHDRRSELDLGGAMSRFGGVLVGGLNEAVTLPKGPIEAIKQEVRNAIAQTKGRRLMIAPGCVIPIATPESHYRAVIEAVNEMPH